MSDNQVALEMRKIYCCAGAKFAGPYLQAGWEEIARLEATIKSLQAQVKADKVFAASQRKLAAVQLKEIRTLQATIKEQQTEIDRMGAVIDRLCSTDFILNEE